MDLKEQSSLTFERLYTEIRNHVLAEAYLVLSDLLDQKQFAKRTKMHEARLCRVLKKMEKSTSQPQTP